MKTTMTRRNVHVPDPVWVRLEDTAREQSETEGRTISVSELIRAAILDYLTREAS